jgi:hypothetical protein
MKLKGKPLLFRTVIGKIRHKRKLYEVVLKEDLTENDFEIWELDSMDSYVEEVDSDSDLGKKLVEFFLIETEDIEQFN